MTLAAADMSALVNEIDQQIRTRLWFDFDVFICDADKLVIAGSKDLCYYHEMEIIFENVFIAKGFFHGWHSDTSKPVFIQPENVDAFDKEYDLEPGYTVFVFKTEDNDQDDVIVVAKKVSYNTDTVFYYEREDLQEGQRIADFVKQGTIKDWRKKR
jgi:hypothetical protein